MSTTIDSHMHIGQKDLLSEDVLGFLNDKGVLDSISYQMSPEGVIEALDISEINYGVIFPLTFMPPDGKWEKLNDMTATYTQHLSLIHILKLPDFQELMSGIIRC